MKQNSRAWRIGISLSGGSGVEKNLEKLKEKAKKVFHEYGGKENLTRRKLLEAQQFVQAYQTYSEIYSIPDRLRWCRHELGMMQSEVAKDILDDYTLFLNRGGGALLRAYREAKGWNRRQLADHAKVGLTSIRTWENVQKTISHKCFELLMDNLGYDFTAMLHM